MENNIEKWISNLSENQKELALKYCLNELIENYEHFEIIIENNKVEIVTDTSGESLLDLI